MNKTTTLGLWLRGPLAFQGTPDAVQWDTDTDTQLIDTAIANIIGGSAVFGGVSVKTSNYTAQATDNGSLLVFNSASAITLTLPPSPPTAKWAVFVANIGAGALTISPNGLNIDGSGSNLTPINQLQGLIVFTDNTNYFTMRGMGSGAAGVSSLNSLTGALSIVAGTGITVTPSGSNITIAATGGAPTADTYVLGTQDAANLPNSVANPTAYYGPDAQPGTAGSLDDEFNGSSLSGSWTWYNQGSATSAVSKSLLTLLDTASASLYIRGIYKAAPATPWEVELKITAMDIPTPLATFPIVGILITDGTKAITYTLALRSASAINLNLEIDEWTNATTFSSTPAGPTFVMPCFPWYLKVKDDGTNLIFSFSQGGSQFFTFATIGRTSFLTPSNVGITFSSNQSNKTLNGVFDWFRRTL